MAKFTESQLHIIVVLTVCALALIIGGFFCPPMGEIDGSVLTAVGEIFAFAALWTVIYSIKRGADVKITHGNTDITIDNPDNNEAL